MYRKMLMVLGMVILLSGCAGKTSDELLAEGLKELRTGNATGAIVLFRNALEKNQNHFEARYQLAKAYMLVAKYEQAEKEFQKVQRLTPGRVEFKLDLAKLYNALNKPDAALGLAQEYLQANPRSAEALETIGVSYMQKKMSTEAEAFFLRALESEPGRTTAKLELAEVLVVQEKDGEAKELLRQVIAADARNSRAYYALAGIENSRGNGDQALLIYGQIAAIFPADPVAVYRIGLLQLDRGDTTGATKNVDELIRKFPKRAEGYRLQGIVSYRQKNFKEAINSLQNAVRIHPTTGDLYFLGLSLYNTGELENAMNQCRKILDRSPSFVQAKLLAGMILLRQKRVDEAIVELEQLNAADGANAHAHNVLGSAYMAKGRYEEGMRELDVATRLDPKIVDAYLKKGMFHLSQGKSQEFEGELMAAVKVAPDILNSRFVLASYYLGRKNPSKALETLMGGLQGKKEDSALYTGMARIELAASNPGRGLPYLAKAKEVNAEAFDPYFVLSAYYLENGDEQKALGELSALLQKDPQNVKAMLHTAAIHASKQRERETLDSYLQACRTKKPEAFLALTQHYAKKNDMARALSTLDEALKHNPRTAAVLEMKSHLLVKQKRYKEALQVLDDLEAISPERGIAEKTGIHLAMKNIPQALGLANRAILLQPQSAEGYLLAATVHEGQHDYNRAIEELKKGLNADPRNVRASLKLADMYARSGDLPQALKTTEGVVRFRPDFAPAHVAQGIFLSAGGRFREAVASYVKALSFADNYVPALNNLANLYADGYGDRKEAVRLAKTAVAVEPGNAGVMDTLGYVLLKNNQPREALSALEKAVTSLPNDPTVNYHLALAYKATGDTRHAAAILQKALTSGTFPEMRQAQALAANLK